MIGVCRLADGLIYLLDIDRLVGADLFGRRSSDERRADRARHGRDAPRRSWTRRAESLALESVEEEVSDRVSLLLFRIGDEWYAVRVGDVREIFQEYDVTSRPVHTRSSFWV